ncbi:MAG: 50S ribosomal protein L4 [Chloroflexota bacterium]|nr:50S ribosomal protein L4 [Chloroflexota bacterium]
MQVPLRDTSGQVIETIEAKDEVFGLTPHRAAIHQTLVGHLANARVGTADTKTRGEVAGSTRKLYRQKGTGMARAGSSRSPTRRGGGIAHGPHPRSYTQNTPKKMRRLALKSVLSAKAAGGELMVLQDMNFEKPHTKDMVHMLQSLGVDSTALIVTLEPQINVIKSARNIPGIKTLPAPYLNVVDLLSYQKVIMTLPALRRVEEIWGPKEAAATA